jgi:hypothetical protein
VLGGVSDVALIYYPSCTDSIKPSLQFPRNFVVNNASDGITLFPDFITGLQYFHEQDQANQTCHTFNFAAVLDIV